MAAGRDRLEVACQQVLLGDGLVFSIQWSDMPARFASQLTPESLLERYLIHIRGCTAGIVRPHRRPDGIQFRLAGGGPSLLSFLPPVREGNSLVMRIRGGLLAQTRRGGQGELRLGMQEQRDAVRVTLQLSDYRPSILGNPSPSFVRRWLYGLSQAAVHRKVTVRFLAQLYRELSGVRPRVRVVAVSVREGEPL